MGEEQFHTAVGARDWEFGRCIAANDAKRSIGCPMSTELLRWMARPLLIWMPQYLSLNTNFVDLIPASNMGVRRIN